jgi:superfamily II DNA or RNA helicase
LQRKGSYQLVEQGGKGRDPVAWLQLSVGGLNALRGLYGNSRAEFKSEEQAEAVRLALERSEDVVVILPTGGGKSVVFMAPAWIEKELTTVVIVPFVALIEEMKVRCMERGLSCYIWKSSGTILPQRMAQVVLVGVEGAVDSGFQQFLVRLEQAHKLARIVIDECHTILTQRNFRGVMRRLTATVRCVGVQVMLLTATLPLEMEQELQLILGCVRMKSVRKRGERLGLKYSVLQLPKEGSSREDLDMEVANLLQARLSGFEDDDRAIVYCLERKWAEEVTGFLNGELGEEVCGTYHAEMELEQRRAIYRRWSEGDLTCIVATSALGAGIDQSGVRLVIHHGHGRSMIDQCQEMGRGGRDGNAAECITIFWPGIIEKTSWIPEAERGPVIEWIEGLGCRRLGIGVYLNGAGVDCISLPGCQWCDRCEEACGRVEEWRRSVADGEMGGRRGSGMLLEAREVQDGSDLREMIKEMRGRCMVCFFGGRSENDKHELQRCRYVSDLRWRLMLGLDSCLNFVYTVRVGNILGEIVRRVNSREEAAALYVDCHRRHMERIFMEMSELGSAQM